MLPLASSIPSLSWPEVLGRLALAAALGAVLGFERELRETIEIRQEVDRRTLELTVDVPRPEQARKLISKLAEVEHVLEVRWVD